MDRALEHGHQLLRHRQRLRLEDSARASPSRSSAAGSRRAAAAARRSCSPPRCTARWATGPTTQGLSARHIVTACEASLRRLQTDYIDLYQMHHVYREHAVGGDLAGDGDARRAGQGASTSARRTSPAGTSPQAQEAAARRHFLGLVSEQCIYNLLTRHVELEVLPGRAGTTASASSRGRRCTAGCSAARCASSPRARRRAPRRAAPADDARRSTGRAIEAYEKLCADARRGPGRRGAGLAAVPARRDRADHRPAHDRAARRPAARARTSRCREETLARLDELFPPVGNGGPGPEAWAW